MTHDRRRLFVYPEGLGENALSSVECDPGDVLLASTREQKAVLTAASPAENVWLSPASNPEDLAKHVRNKLLEFHRFTGLIVEIIVVEGAPKLVKALKTVLKAREPTTSLQGNNVAIRLKPSFADEFIGDTDVMHDLRSRIDAIAADICPILIVGPTGSGKELVAKRLHDKSGRTGPFTALNGAMLNPEFAESKLFGHVKGAFTGAMGDEPGRIEQAKDGTFFLDELFHVPTSVQPKLLRAIANADSGRLHIQPLGTTKERTLEIRLVTATQHHPLDTREKSSVRDDLYYRVAGEVLQVPPLVERLDDLATLTEYFAGGDVGIDSDAIDVLRGHSWPGNVRELKLVIKRALRRDPQRLTAPNIRESLDRPRYAARRTIEPPCDLRRELATIELQTRAAALQRYGTQAEAARHLQIRPTHWKADMDKLKEKVDGQ